MNVHDIIIRPLVTEKSMDDMEQGKYTFVVARGANKSEIKKAIEQIFDVTVDRVNTMNMRGKMKRQGATQGGRPYWKKAIVKLTEDSKSIEFFDGMQ